MNEKKTVNEHLTEIEKTRKLLNSQADKILTTIQPVNDHLDRIVNLMNPIIELQKNISDLITRLFPTDYFASLKEGLSKIEKDPNSFLNWYSYLEKMNEYFWIFPYAMSTNELLYIVNNVNNEKDFDSYMRKYFNKKKVENLVKEINKFSYINFKRKFFRQAVLAYESKLYAVAGASLILIIEGLLSFYLINKSNLKRIDIFKPICEKLEKSGTDENFLLACMLNSNINKLYADTDFNKKINVDTNKKVRRHLVAHGKSFAYNKIDVIMLLNTIYYLLYAQKEFVKYKESLYWDKDNKTFQIATPKKKKEILDNIKKNRK